jgi:hypothetical protein
MTARCYLLCTCLISAFFCGHRSLVCGAPNLVPPLPAPWCTALAGSVRDGAAAQARRAAAARLPRAPQRAREVRAGACVARPALTSVLRSATLYVLGVACVLAMPFAARNTYMDENALLAGARTRQSQPSVAC